MQHNNIKIETGREIDLGHLGRIFIKRLWLIVAVSILCGICSYSYSKLFIKPTYESYFTAYVNNKIADTGVNTSTGDLTASMGLVYVYQDIMTSRSVLQQAAKDCGTTYAAIKGSVRASVSETAPVVRVTVNTTNKKLSLKIAQRIAELAPGKVAEVVDGSSMRVIDEPVLATGKASPNSSKHATTGAMIAFMFATVLFVFRDLVYDTVQSTEDIERRYSVPVIGNIPDVYQAERSLERYGYRMAGGKRK